MKRQFLFNKSDLDLRKEQSASVLFIVQIRWLFFLDIYLDDFLALKTGSYWFMCVSAQVSLKPILNHFYKQKAI